MSIRAKPIVKIANIEIGDLDKSNNRKLSVHVVSLIDQLRTHDTFCNAVVERRPDGSLDFIVGSKGVSLSIIDEKSIGSVCVSTRYADPQSAEWVRWNLLRLYKTSLGSYFSFLQGGPSSVSLRLLGNVLASDFGRSHLIDQLVIKQTIGLEYSGD